MTLLKRDVYFLRSCCFLIKYNLFSTNHLRYNFVHLLIVGRMELFDVDSFGAGINVGVGLVFGVAFA